MRKKPDALATAEIRIEEGESPLKADSFALAMRFAGDRDQAEVSEEMQQILTFFARSRGTTYSSELGWGELLAPFMSVPLSRGDRYNCFYVLMAKYAVKDCSVTSPAFAVFRLLLLYHDAELCSLLDTLKIGPQNFAQTCK